MSTKAHGQIARITWQYSLTINYFQVKLNSHELMAIQSITIQPRIYGHIAVQLWSHKFLAIQPNKIGYIVEGFRLDSQNLMAIQLGYIAILKSNNLARNSWLYSRQLYSQRFLAIQLSSQIAKNSWLYSQEFLAIQSSAIQPRIFGYIANSQIT